jgi:hypothetical protein
MQRALKQLGKMAERVTALVLGSVMPGQDFHGAVQMLEQAPAATWRFYVFGTLGLLFLLALISASFGVIGLALYFGAVVLLIR